MKHYPRYHRQNSLFAQDQEWYVQHADTIACWQEEFNSISKFDTEFFRDFQSEINIDLLLPWAINQDDSELINKISMIPHDMSYITKNWFRKSNLKEPTSSIAVAAHHGKNKALDMLLACGVNPDTCGKTTGKTALMIALENSKTDNKIPQMLIESGANINARCKKGWTPLDYLYVNEIDFIYDDTNSYSILKQYLISCGAVPGAGASQSNDQNYDEWEERWMV